MGVACMNYKFFCFGVLLISLLSALTTPASATPVLDFTAPTRPNGTTIAVNWTQANISVTGQNLDAFKFDWNGLGYSVYDSSLVLPLNYNNNSALGDNSSTAADSSEYGNNGRSSPSTENSGDWINEAGLAQDLGMNETSRGWTQDGKIYTDHVLYENSEQFLFSVDLDKPQDVNVSITSSNENLLLKDLYVWVNGTWQETNYSNIPAETTLFFRQDYGVNVTRMPGIKGKFNITVTGDKGFYALSDPWYSSSWTRRRDVTVSNGGSAQTNYPVTVTVAYDSDMKSDFSDIRFTASDATTLLNYWVESNTSSSTATVWVKINTIPSGGSTIYMYYGNPSAATTSSGPNTFTFFEDFNGGSLNASKWVNGTSTTLCKITQASGYLRENCTNTATKVWEYIGSVNSYSLPFTITGSFRTPASNAWGCLSASSANTITYDQTNTIPIGWQRISTSTSASLFYLTRGPTSVTLPYFTANTWTTISLRFATGASYADVGGISYSNNGTFSNTTGYVVIYMAKWAGSISQIDCDWIAVRGYAATEPTASVSVTEYYYRTFTDYLGNANGVMDWGSSQYAACTGSTDQVDYNSNCVTSGTGGSAVATGYSGHDQYAYPYTTGWLDLDGNSTWPALYGANVCTGGWINMSVGDSTGERCGTAGGDACSEDGNYGCCGDDSGEYSKTETGSTDAPSGYNDGIYTCCDSSTDCNYNYACNPSGGASAPAIPNKAYCSSGTWYGGDAGQTYCDAIKGANYWNLGGEVNATVCCGDDSGENRITETGSTDAPSGYNDGITTCCDTSTDCTYDDACTANTGASATAIPNKAYCSSNTWYGGDAGQTYCDAIKGTGYWNLGGEINATVCCGDDSGENKITSVAGTGMESVADLVACCDTSTDCAAANTCTPQGSSYDADGNGDTDYCAASNTWVDCNSDSNCPAGQICSSNDCIVDVTAPVLNFSAPTKENGTTITTNWTQVNISVTEQSLDTFKFKWNGTNYSIYDSSLVLALNFDNNSLIGENGSRVVDVSSYGLAGNCSGSTCPNWTSSGVFGGAYQFDGLDDFFILPGVNAGMVTVSVWYKPRPSSQTMQALFENRDSWSSGEYGLYAWDSGNIFFQAYPIECDADPSYTKTDDLWHHLVGEHNGSIIRIFLDGVQIKNCSGTISSGTQTTSYLGAWNGDRYFNGSMDELRVYSRYLSDQEIWMQYQSEFQKYNSTTYLFYANVTNLSLGTYTYYGWANDTSGNSAYTNTYTASSPRYLTVGMTSVISINVTVDTIDFGSGAPASGIGTVIASNETNLGGWSSNVGGFIVQNTGTSNVKLTVYADKNASVLIGGTNPTYRFASYNPAASPGCSGSMQYAWTDIAQNATTAKSLCDILNYSGNNTVGVNMQLYVPADAAVISNSNSTLTFIASLA